MKLFLRLLLFCAVLVVLHACSDLFGINKGTITLDCDDFSDDITLDHEDGRSVDYIIDCLVDVNDIDIGIGENVVIEFTEGSGLIINDDAKLTIVSLIPGEMITLKGKESEKGYWKGIILNSNHNISRIANATISDAGDASDSRFKGGINVLTHGWITNSNIENMGGYGIYVEDNAKIRDGLVDLRFKNCSSYPVSVPIPAWGEFVVVTPPAGDLYGNITSTNCIPNKIEVREGNQAELKKLSGDIFGIGIPYELKGDVIIPQGNKFHLSPGVEIEVNKNKRIFIYGSFQCSGESSNPVYIKGLEDVLSFWGGIYIDKNTNIGASYIDYLHISNGGGGNYENANLTMRSGNYVVENCKIFNSGACGILFNENDATLTENSNTFINNSGGHICDY